MAERSYERPSERRTAARTAVVWEALRPLLEQGPRDVLDIGGGTGVHAVRAAEHGHRVTVVDPSPDALAALQRRANEAGVTVTGIQGDLSSLEGVVDSAGYDVVLCHGVLEVLGDADSFTPVHALAALGRSMRPEAVLSLLVSQRSAAVVARAMGGSFARANELLDQPAGVRRSGDRFSEAEVRALLASGGWNVNALSGVRIFSDLVPGALVEAEAGAAQALVELERVVSTRPEYFPLASQLHVLASR